jgi:aspartate carbamoyltransferase regulatory subunit
MLNVESIESGTVIDHIKAGKGKKVMDLLKIDDSFTNRVAVVMNVPSKKLGKKDIVKIEGMFVSDEIANLIALVAPNSSINIIKNSEVANKYVVSLPKQLKGVGVCPNPNCITNFEYCEKSFKEEKENSDEYRCTYCERLSKAEELVK